MSVQFSTHIACILRPTVYRGLRKFVKVITMLSLLSEGIQPEPELSHMVCVSHRELLRTGGVINLNRDFKTERN